MQKKRKVVLLVSAIAELIYSAVKISIFIEKPIRDTQSLNDIQAVTKVYLCL